MALPREVVALVVAAGRGLRAGGAVAKQFALLAGRPVVAHSVAAFCAHPFVDRVAIVVPADDAADVRAVLSGIAGAEAVTLCPGGDTRQASVRAGLDHLAALGVADDAVVLVHDAARPLVSAAMITAAIAAAARHGAAIPVLPVPDTVARLDATGAIAGFEPRAPLRLVQTPQAFGFGLLRAAHHAAGVAAEFTDDASILRAANHPVATFPGDPDLMKITLPEDFARVERARAPAAAAIRGGTGFDVHAFGDHAFEDHAFGSGDFIMLGGVAVPHGQSLVGHSDADPLLHAITDALLGALADRDIGAHFPPSDPQWQGAASAIFLAHAVGLLTARGGRILNLDGTVMCEAPRVGPHRDAMRLEIARICAIAPGRVAVKATTTEKLGFTGRREGIAAFASATVLLPGD